MNNAVVILLVVCIALCAVLFFYPLSALVFRIFNKRKINVAQKYSSPVSIIISCYNEELFIRNKILSIIDAGEWIEGSELIVVSGGSTDKTNKILEEFRHHKNIHLFIFAERLGKIASVNLAVSRSAHDILVFSDCRQKMKKGSIKRLMANFEDPSIGTVSSTLMDGRHGNSSSLVRTILNSIAFNESACGSSLNIFGALYAQRKSIFKTIPTDILFDDLFVVVSTITQHKRLIQEKDAIIFDIHFDRYYTKERIERLTRGLLVFLFKYKNLIGELPLGAFIRFMIYKYIKLLMPFLFIAIFVCSAYLILPLITLKLLLGFIASALLLLSIKKSRKLLLLFVRINWYFMTATLKFLFLNQRSISWQKIQMDGVK